MKSGFLCPTDEEIKSWETTTDQHLLERLSQIARSGDCGMRANPRVAVSLYLRWVELNVGRDDAEAAHQAFNLIYFYEDGIGVPQDFVTAYAWASICISLGPTDFLLEHAKKRRSHLMSMLSADGVAKAQERAEEILSGMRRRKARAATPAPVPASYGTAFFVSAVGHAVTNQHVVDGCQAVNVLGRGAVVMSSDSVSDIALLHVGVSPKGVATFRVGGGVAPGDSAVVVGYPLSNVLSSASPNVTTGVISSLAGPGEDRRLFQITAPIQPGNSGGPLLDSSGNVIGVVVSTLSTLSMANATGAIPQNINFAIKASAVRALLESHDISFQTAKSGQKVETSEIATRASQYTVQVECTK